jgi:hypothetical protein
MSFLFVTVFYKYLNVAKFSYSLLGPAPIYTAKYIYNKHEWRLSMFSNVNLASKSPTAHHMSSEFLHNATLPIRMSKLQRCSIKAGWVASNGKEVKMLRLLGFSQDTSPPQHTPTLQSSAVLEKTGISCFRMNPENDLPNGTHLAAVHAFSLQLQRRSSLGWIWMSCTSEELDTLFHNILFSIVHLYRLLTTRRPGVRTQASLCGIFGRQSGNGRYFFPSASVYLQS